MIWGVGMVWSLGPGAAQARQPTPNVLFIMADDLNTALSGYGHVQCKTPNLDKLAETGMSFTRAYCQFPICGPSRASIMSGQYPEKNGVLGNGGNVEEDRVTLPRHFKNHGYWTGRVSKIYHMGVPGGIMGGLAGNDHPSSWDYCHNVRAMESLTPGKAEDLTGPDSTPLYPELRKQWEGLIPGTQKLMIPGNHQGSDYVVVETEDDSALLADGMAANKAIEVLRTRAEKQGPFFLAVGFIRPHAPFVAPERDFARYDYRRMMIPNVPMDDQQDFPPQARGSDIEASEAGRKKIHRGYYGSIAYMDRQVGRLLDELDQLKLRDNTIVVFISDHGYLLGEHRLWRKNQLWEEAVRVPMIISIPGQAVRGVQCDHVVELVDLYPTLQELTGLPSDAGAQGMSLAPLLEDPKHQLSRSEAFIQNRNGYCLRNEKWAYMWYPADRRYPDGFMLYDMENDPEQYHNLAQSPKFENERERLHERLRERIKSARN
jgi:arylsulfatase A-like enzyme